jgi:GntR family transcriptional regulator / MocR family aminotransferase
MLRPWELHFHIDIQNSKAIYLQIADAIIEAIKSGKLVKGYFLPGSRKLAELLKVNRNTIVQAIDVLLIEGWLTSVERKGVFVSESFPSKNSQRNLTKLDTKIPVGLNIEKPNIIFDDGLPDSKHAPIDDLAKAYREIFSRNGRWQMMGYTDPQGNYQFREAISQMLNFKRNLNTTPENIFVSRGSQMAMYLAAQSIIENGDIMIVENPGYKPAWQTFENAGAVLLPVSVDNEGINIDEIKKIVLNRKVKAIYVTPHHQFPTTVSLSIKRRFELIELSNQFGFYIIEDDYDHEFHFNSRPLFPVGSLAPLEHYIYIGTFSKIVAPALRIGYLYTNERVLQRIADLRKIIDVQGDVMMEQAVLQLINDGTIKRHIKRVTSKYEQKRNLFETLLREYMNDKVEFQKPNGGLAFWLMPKSKVDIFQLSVALEKKAIKILTPDKYSFNEPIMGLRLGFASLSDEKLEIGIKTIASLLN